MIWLLILLPFLQERADERMTFARMENLEVDIEANGDETVKREVVKNFAPLFRFENHLESEEFRSNLDLSLAQKTDLEDLSKRASKFRIELSQKYKAQINSEAASKEYWKFAGQLDAEAQDILLQHQMERADQLVQLAALRERGVPAYFTIVAPAGEFELSKEESARLAEMSASLSGRIDNELKQLSDSLLAAVTKSLDAQQTEFFKRQCENVNILSDYLFAVVEFLNAHPKQRGDSESLIEMFREHVSLRWSPAEQRWIRGRGILSAWDAVSNICELLLNDESLVLAEFSDDQRAAVKALHEEIHRRVIGFSEDNPYPTTQEAREQFQKLRLQFDSALDQYAQDQLLEQILLPHQIEAVAKQAERKKFARMGPIVRLLRGHFDDYLKIDDEQREKINNDIEQAVEVLDQGLLALERSFRKEMIGALDDENQRKLKAAIGDEPQFSHGSVYLVRKSIQTPNERLRRQVTGEANKNPVPSK